MGQQTIPVLKEKFSNGKTPPQEDFWDFIESYWHKSEKIPATAVFEFDELLKELLLERRITITTQGTEHRMLIAEVMTIYQIASIGLGSIEMSTDGGATWTLLPTNGQANAMINNTLGITTFRFTYEPMVTEAYIYIYAKVQKTT